MGVSTTIAVDTAAAAAAAATTSTTATKTTTIATTGTTATTKHNNNNMIRRERTMKEQEVVVNNIIGGTPANDGEFPSFGRLPGCGGTLIYPDLVLTSAQCLPGIDSGTNYIYIGSIDVNSGERLEIQYAIPHPNFDKIDNLFFINDLMILKLSRPSRTGIIQALNYDVSVPSIGQDVIGVGFGSENGPSELSDVLLKVTVQSVDPIQCAPKYAKFNETIHTCAGTDDGGKDTCSNDAGGPLYIDNGSPDGPIQIGITSFGDGCGKPGIPGVYTKISYYQTWIESTICQNARDPPSTCESGSNCLTLCKRWQLLCRYRTGCLRFRY